MKSLCKDCISFFHIQLPEKSYSVYDVGKCEGCWKKSMTTNPNYFLRVVEKENFQVQENYALIAAQKLVN